MMNNTNIIGVYKQGNDWIMSRYIDGFCCRYENNIGFGWLSDDEICDYVSECFDGAEVEVWG